MNSVGIARQLQITHEFNNIDQIEGIERVQLHLCRHAFPGLTNVLRVRMIMLRQLVRHSIRAVIDGSTKTGLCGMDNIETIAQIFFGATPVFMSRLGSTCFFTRVGEAAAGFRI